MKTPKTEEEKVKDMTNRLGHLQAIRQPFESDVDECIEFTTPDLQIITADTQKGKRGGGTIYDGTAIAAVNLLADGLHGYLVSPSMRWFSLTLPMKIQTAGWSGNMRQWGGKSLDEMPDVKEWLESVEDVMYGEFRASNFYETMPGVFRQGGSIGTVTLFCETDETTGQMYFYVPHFRECYVAQNVFGKVDTLYRKFKLTCRDLARKFGAERMAEIDPNFTQMYETSPYSEREVIHAIYPRTDYDSDKVDAQNMPIASMWMLTSGHKKLIAESGYQYSPANTWRWNCNSNEWYGRSPAWAAMTDILLAQQQAMTNLRAGHRASDPPYAMLESMRGRTNLTPGGRTYLQRGEEVPQILDSGLRGLPVALEFQARTDKAIREHFYVDFFMMLSQAAFENVNMTATQVIEMQGEKAAILGTRIGRLQSEELNPIIDQVFTIVSQSGKLPPPPDILYEYAGNKMEVDYMGPLAQAQKRLFKTQSIQAAMQQLAGIVQTAPESLDIIDIDELTREILAVNGMPGKCIRTEDEVSQIRAARSQAIQAQQVQQGLLDMTKALPGMSKAVEPNSPLAAMAGGQA